MMADPTTLTAEGTGPLGEEGTGGEEGTVVTKETLAANPAGADCLKHYGEEGTGLERKGLDKRKGRNCGPKRHFSYERKGPLEERKGLEEVGRDWRA